MLGKKTTLLLGAAMPKKCHMSLFVLFGDLGLHLVQQDTIRVQN